MGRKKIPLVNRDNSVEFVDYIRARVKKYTAEHVSELTQLVAEATDLHNKLELRFENEYNIFVHEPDTHTDEHRQVLTAIDEDAFKQVNDVVETIPRLKIAFRNAQAQKRHKVKNKLTANEKHVVEMRDDEYFYFKLLRTLCKENGIDLADQLKLSYRELRSDLKNTTTEEN